MTHEQQICLDVDLYGVAYERLLPNGTVERIDPTTIRVHRIKERSDAFPCPTSWEDYDKQTDIWLKARAMKRNMPQPPPDRVIIPGKNPEKPPTV